MLYPCFNYNKGKKSPDLIDDERIFSIFLQNAELTKPNDDFNLSNLIITENIEEEKFDELKFITRYNTNYLAFQPNSSKTSEQLIEEEGKESQKKFFINKINQGIQNRFDNTLKSNLIGIDEMIEKKNKIVSFEELDHPLETPTTAEVNSSKIDFGAYENQKFIQGFDLIFNLQIYN